MEKQDQKPAATFKEWKSSTQVQSTSYDVAQHVLTVTFNNGGVYEYYEVPAEKYQELLATDSIGKFLGREIKGVYEFRKVG